jgi:hypothetical protein
LLRTLEATLKEVPIHQMCALIKPVRVASLGGAIGSVAALAAFHLIPAASAEGRCVGTSYVASYRPVTFGAR